LTYLKSQEWFNYLSYPIHYIIYSILISYRNVLLIITRHNELAKAIYATETARSNPSSIDASCSWTGLLVQMACLMTCSNLNNKRLPAINGITCTPSMGGWSIDGLKRVR
jgi:hypothetical protein